MENFLLITNSPRFALAKDYVTPGPALSPDEVRDGLEIPFSIQPVLQNAPGSNPIYASDSLDTDVDAMAIGNFDTPPTGGFASLIVGVTTTGLGTISGTITASALQTALNAALTTEGKPICAVVLVRAGAYQCTANSNGAITAGFFGVVSDVALYPTSTAFFQEGTLGSASSPYVVTFIMQQSPMCYAEATGDLPDVLAAITTVQVGSGTANKIQNILFPPGTFGGSITLAAVADGVTATCGTMTPFMTVAQLGAVLATHESIHYNDLDGTPNNVAIRIVAPLSYNVEFIDDLANSNDPALSIANQAMLGPVGKTGTIDYNTYNLWLYSLTQTGDKFNLTRQIKRTRASGEQRTLYSQTVTIYKSMINGSTAVPTPLPSFYTTTESNIRFARRDSDSAVLVGVITGASIAQRARLLPITNGVKLQISLDGVSWQDSDSWIAT